MDYLWFKAVHVFAVLLWVGGVIANGVLLAVVARTPQGVQDEVLTRFRKWDVRVSNPVQGLAWIAGITLIVMGGWISDGWLHVKLAAVIAIAAVHGVQSATLRKLVDRKDVSRRLEIARHTALVTMIAVGLIAIMVIVKPF